MKLALTGTLEVIKAHRTKLDGRLRSGFKVIPTGYTVAVRVPLGFDRLIVLAGPYSTQEEAEAVKARYAEEFQHLKAEQ